MTRYAIYLPVDNEFLKVNDEYYFDLENALEHLEDYQERMKIIGRCARNSRDQKNIVAQINAAKIVEVRLS